MSVLPFQKKGTKHSAENFLKLFSKDAIDDEVDWRVKCHLIDLKNDIHLIILFYYKNLLFYSYFTLCSCKKA